jgi:hypothetical protein
MTTEEKIAVLTAYKNKEQIQEWRQGTEHWEDTDDPSWDFDTFDYRVKQVPKEFLVDETMTKDGPVYNICTCEDAHKCPDFVRRFLVREVTE